MRLAFVTLAAVTIAAGLTVHRADLGLSPAARDVLGDALWAAMIVWWIGAALPGLSVRALALVALAICFAVETSQLYHAPALDALRSTRAGHLVLGSGFDPRDLAAYTLGVVLACGLVRLAIPGNPRRLANARERQHESRQEEP